MSLAEVGRRPVAIHANQTTTAMKDFCNARIVGAVESFEQGGVAKLGHWAFEVQVLGENVLGLLPVAEVLDSRSQAGGDVSVDETGIREEAGRLAGVAQTRRLALEALDAVVANKYGFAMAGRVRIDWTAGVFIATTTDEAVFLQPGINRVVISGFAKPSCQHADLEGGRPLNDRTSLRMIGSWIVRMASA